MRIESSVISVSWLPGEAIEGIVKLGLRDLRGAAAVARRRGGG